MVWLSLTLFIIIIYCLQWTTTLILIFCSVTIVTHIFFMNRLEIPNYLWYQESIKICNSKSCLVTCTEFALKQLQLVLLDYLYIHLLGGSRLLPKTRTTSYTRDIYMIFYDISEVLVFILFWTWFKYSEAMHIKYSSQYNLKKMLIASSSI